MKTKWPVGARVMNLHSGSLGRIVEREGRSVRVTYDGGDWPDDWDVSQVGTCNTIVSEDFQHNHGDINARVKALLSKAQSESFQYRRGFYVEIHSGKDRIMIWRCDGKTRITISLFGLDMSETGLGVTKAEAMEDLQQKYKPKTT